MLIQLTVELLVVFVVHPLLFSQKGESSKSGTSLVTDNGIEYIFSIIEAKQLKDEVGMVYNFQLTESGLWLGSNNGLFLYDSKRMQRFTADQSSYYHYRDLIQLEKSQFLVGLQKRDDQHIEVSRTCLFNTVSKQFTEVPTPIKGYLAQWNASVFLFNSQHFYCFSGEGVWKSIQPNLELVRLASQFYSDFNQPESKGNKEKRGQKVYSVFSASNGRFSLELRGVSNGRGPLEGVTFEKVGGASEKLFDFELPLGKADGNLFYTPQTRECWWYNSTSGQLNAVHLGDTIASSCSINIMKYTKGGGCNSVFTDKGNVWISTSHGEILWIRRRPFQQMQVIDLNKSVRSIHYEHGITYLGTYSGVLQASGLGVETGDFKEGVSATPIYSFNTLEDGKRILLAANKLLITDDLKEGEIREIEPRFQFGEPWCAKQKGRFIYIGSNYGIFQCKLNDWAWAMIPIGSVESPVTIHGFLALTEKEWLAYGEKGFYRMLFEGDSVVSCNPDYHLNLTVFSVYCESDRRWWLCTSMGLLAFNPLDRTMEQLESLLFLKGLQVYSAYSDRQGNLWCSTENGLVLITRERTDIYRFGRPDGRKWEFNRNAHLKYPDGGLLFGGVEGICYLDPGDFYLSERLEDGAVQVQLANAHGEAFEQLEGRIWTLPVWEDHVQIWFHGFWTSSEYDRYAYRIKGVEKEWEVGFGPSIQVMDLPFGCFSLEVYREVEGQWVKLKDIRIQRNWPFRTWLVIAFLLFLLLIGFMMIFRATNNYKFGVRFLNAFWYQGQRLKWSPSKTLTTETMDPSPVVISGLALEWKERMDAILEVYYSDPELEVTGIAKLLATSRRQLYRNCKEYLGQSPIDYLINFRLEKAAYQLDACPRTQISDIAFETGFKSPSHFSKRFQEKYSVAPKVYARRVIEGLPKRQSSS